MLINEIASENMMNRKWRYVLFLGIGLGLVGGLGSLVSFLKNDVFSFVIFMVVFGSGMVLIGILLDRAITKGGYYRIM